MAGGWKGAREAWWSDWWIKGGRVWTNARGRLGDGSVDKGKVEGSAGGFGRGVTLKMRENWFIGC